MQRTCVKCGHVHSNASGSPVESCPRCGAIYSKLESLTQSGAMIRAVVPPTPEERARAARAAKGEQEAAAAHLSNLLEQARRSGNWRGIDPEVVRLEARGVVVTTTSFVPGREVAEICSVVAAEQAHAFGAIYEEFAGLLRNVVGSGRSAATSRLLQESRAAVLADLRFKALDCGANAVIDLKFDYEEFSGANGHGVMVVVGTGTAVRLGSVSQLRIVAGQAE